MGEDPRAIRNEIEETRERMGDTVDALAYKADVKTRAKESVSDKVDTIKSKVTGAKDSVAGAKDSVVESTPGTADVKHNAKRAVGIAQENPLGLAVGSLAAGFLAGMLIPSTRVEDEKLGPMADQVKEKAAETGQQALEHGKQVAQDVAERGKEAASQAAQETKEAAKESGREHGEQVASTAKDKASQTREQVRSRT